MGKASISIAITSAFNSAGLTKASSGLSSLGSALSRVEKLTAASAASTSSDLAAMGRSWEEYGSRVSQMGAKMEAVGASLTRAVTLPMVAVGGYASTMAVQFDTAMADLRKVSNMTEAELEGFAQSALKLSQTQPVDAATILSVEALGKQLGISQGKLESFAKVATGLDIATNMDAETAATEMARFANIVGMSEDEMENYGSTLVNIGNTMATTESEVSNMAQRFASAGSQAGLSSAEILAMSAAMSSLGIRAEMGGSALSQVFVSISNAVANGGESLEAFAAAANMSADDFASAWRGNAADAFNQLIESIGRASAEGTDMNVIMGQLGITQIRQSDVMRRLAGSTEAVTGKQSILGTALENSRKAWEENTALQAEVDQRNESMASRLQVLKNKVDAIAITVGRPLVDALIDCADALSPVIQAVADAAQAFADMDEAGQRNILMWAGVAAAAGPALSVVGKLAQAMGGGISAFGRFAEKASVYADAMNTVDGSQMRTYASAKSMASQIGMAGNAAAKAAGGAENYVRAWEGMYDGARRYSSVTEKLVSVNAQVEASGDKASKSILKTQASLLKQQEAARGAFEANGRLVSSYTGSTAEMEKWARVCDEATGGQTKLASSAKKVSREMKSASGGMSAAATGAGKASKSFDSVARSAVATGKSMSKIGSMAGYAAKSLGSMALEAVKMAGVGVAIAGITAAVGAVVGAIVTWKQRQDDLATASESFADMQQRVASETRASAGAMGDYSLSVGEVARASREALTDTVNLRKSIEDSFTEVAANSGALDGYLATIGDLANKSGLSAAEQVKLKAAVEGYNEITGDQVSVIDAVNGKLADQNGTVIDSTKALYDNADAWERNAYAQAAQEKLTEAYKDQIEQQRTLAEAQEAYNQTLEELAGKDLSALNFADAMKLDEATKGLEDAQTALDGTSESIEGLTATAALAGANLSDALTSAVRDLPTSMQSAGVDIATNLAAGIEGNAFMASDAVKFISDAVEGSVSKLPSGMQKTGLEIATSLSAGVSSGRVTLEQATEFMTSTVGSVLASLPTEMQGKGVAAAQALASDLANGKVTVEQASSLLSAAASGALSTLPTDLQGKANSAVLLFNGAIASGAEGALASSLSLSQSAQAGVSGLPGSFGSTGGSAGTSLAEAIGASVGTVGSASSSLDAAARAGVSGTPSALGSTGSEASARYASGIGSGEGATSTAASRVAGATSAMKVSGSYTWGSDLVANFAAGISGAIDWVKSAAISVANAAASILQFSVPDEGVWSGAEMGGMRSGAHLAENIAAGMVSGIPDISKAAGLVGAAMSPVAALPSASPWAQAPGSRAGATGAVINNYTVNIDGARIEARNPDQARLLREFVEAFTTTSSMGVA